MGSVDVVWFVLLVLLAVGYLYVAIKVVGDLVRERSLQAVATSPWVLALLVVPMVCVLLYLVLRGDAMLP